MKKAADETKDRVTRTFCKVFCWKSTIFKNVSMREPVIKNEEATRM